MKKLRVFELAKELSVETRDILKIDKDLAISLENNMSMIDVHDIDRIRKRFQKDAVEITLTTRPQRAARPPAMPRMPPLPSSSG